MKRELITSIRIKKKLFSLLGIVALLCLTSLFVMWASALSEPTMPTLRLDVIGNYKGKGNCLQASSGTIEAWLPDEHNYDPVPKKIGGVTWDVYYGYDFESPPPGTPTLTLVEEVSVHIHIEGSLRRLNIEDSAAITMLSISGCTSTPSDGVQYCVYAHSESGTLTKTGSNTWSVNALIEVSEQNPVGLCVNEWVTGEIKDGFCIPLRLEVVVDGIITK